MHRQYPVFRKASLSEKKVRRQVRIDLDLSSNAMDGNDSTTVYITTPNVDATPIILTTEENGDTSGLISNEAIQYVFTINISIVCAGLCLFGIVANIINIIVFVKMGFKETINIALLALSVSDLCSLVSLLWTCICFNPLLMYADVSFYTFELHLKTGSWTHSIFMRVTSFITVYITLERCLCIVIPLKVKQYLTHRRVMFIIIGIYATIIAGMGPNYATGKLTWKFIPKRNRTMIGFVFTDKRATIEPVTYVINALFVVVSFVGVIVCSTVLIWKLNQRSNWLKESSSVQQENKKVRDRQVIKMVLYVAIIFIVTLTPATVGFFASAMVPEMGAGKRYENTFYLLGGIFFVCDAINSAFNIFIYVKMSTKYSQVFFSLFSRKDKN